MANLLLTGKDLYDAYNDSLKLRRPDFAQRLMSWELLNPVAKDTWVQAANRLNEQMQQASVPESEGGNG